MARRGFFAELQHQARVAAREQERAERNAARQHAAAVRQAEQARKALVRARAQLDRANQAERKRLEKEAREAHLAAMEAEVAERNEELADVYDEIDSLLSSTLGVDDYVDLTALKVTASHPPFTSSYEQPVPPPKAVPVPSEPIFVRPEPPSGLFGLLFGRRKYEAALANAEKSHETAVKIWKANCADVEARNKSSEERHAAEEANRLAMLAKAQEAYKSQCADREAEANENNRKLDALIANLGYGTAEAIQEYISIVLANSAYPEHFEVAHEFNFDATTAELSLTASIPPPSAIPEIKQYKYAKSSDEIVSTSLSQKECRERYASAVNQVALRTFHEVFESDRRGLIKTISLEVGTNTIDPATGRPAWIPFVIAAAERQQFLSFDLSAVVPALTLAKLGSAVSKNPYGLAPAERSGIRRS